MKFAIITHAIHKKNKNLYYAYEPYVREMNLWEKYVDDLYILAPISLKKIKSIESAYQHHKIKFFEVPSFNIKSLKSILSTLITIPVICWKIFKLMQISDHIHLRCPGNIGLLGCIVQIFFPSKPKTIKYAGNWDPKSKQPSSYKLQKWLISNTFLTKNAKVLVYGKWKNQTKNIIPFFTASYSRNEIEKIKSKGLSKTIKLLFVGTFSEGKQPLKSVKAAEILINQGFNVTLDMFGNGVEFEGIEEYINEKSLKIKITLHGSQSKDIVKKAYQESHFLIFISKSEGWPKVVAEAMFWSCLPIASKVSCVEDMLGFGERGDILNPSDSALTIATIIKNYIANENRYLEKVEKARNWSQEYTLEKFEMEIKKLL